MPVQGASLSLPDANWLLSVPRPYLSDPPPLPLIAIRTIAHAPVVSVLYSRLPRQQPCVTYTNYLSSVKREPLIISYSHYGIDSCRVNRQVKGVCDSQGRLPALKIRINELPAGWKYESFCAWRGNCESRLPERSSIVTASILWDRKKEGNRLFADDADRIRFPASLATGVEQFHIRLYAFPVQGC